MPSSNTLTTPYLYAHRQKDQRRAWDCRHYFLMQALKKYGQVVADMQENKEEIAPDALFRLYCSLELELVVSESEIDKWAKQIKSLQERIQCVKRDEEASSYVSSEVEEERKAEEQDAEGSAQASKQSEQKHPCLHAECNMSFAKQSTLRCHEWLSHKKQSTLCRSFILHLQPNDPQYHS